MVSIWMLCASRTPGSERHKALQAGPRPRAPRGPPARPQRQMLSAARPGPACPRACGWGPCAGEGRTQQPGRVARSSSLAKEGSYRAKSPGPGTFCTTNPPFQLGARFAPSPAIHAHQPLKGQGQLAAAGQRDQGLGTPLSLQFGKGRFLEDLSFQALHTAEPLNRLGALHLYRGLVSLGLQALRPCLRFVLPQSKMGWEPQGSRQREDGRCKSQGIKGTLGPERLGPTQ